MIRTVGTRCFAATAMPPISPPPPTGTTTMSGSGIAARSSSAIVPCPAMINGSSNAGTSVAPVCFAIACVCAKAAA